MARPKNHSKNAMLFIILPVLFNLAYFVIGTSMVSYTDKMNASGACRNIDPESRNLISFYGWFVALLSGLSLLFTAGTIFF